MMGKKIYIIKYTVKSKNGSVLKHGKIKAKNRLSELDAQVKLEEWLKKKYSNFGGLIVHECHAENPIEGIFGNIFGSDNPFGF